MSDLKAEVEAAVLVEVERMGGTGKIARASIAAQFDGRGVHRATLFRWIDRFLDSGRPGEHLARMVRGRADEREASAGSPEAAVAAVAEEVAAKLPVPITPGDVAGKPTLDLVAQLRAALAAAEQVMAYARTDEGKVRNAKLLLAATDRVNGAIRTALQLQQAMVGLQQMQQFHAAIIAELRAESPAMAERVLMRLNRLTMEWGG